MMMTKHSLYNSFEITNSTDAGGGEGIKTKILYVFAGIIFIN